MFSCSPSKASSKNPVEEYYYDMQSTQEKCKFSYKAVVQFTNP